LDSFGGDVDDKVVKASSVNDRGPLQALIDIVPENLIFSASDNGNMLQIIFFTILFGVAMLMLPDTKTEVLKRVFEAGNEVILKMVDIIMLAPQYAVRPLIVSGIAESPPVDIFKPLPASSLPVFLGLATVTF